jgi:hypothetical protein
MNWKLKAHCLAVLSRVPAGRYLYRRLQTVLGTNVNDIDLGVRRAVEVIDLIAQTGRNLEGATVYEIGTGWFPYVPFLLALSGARRVITVDVNPWLTEVNVRATYRALESRLDQIAGLIHVEPNKIRARYASGSRVTDTRSNLLSAFGIEYCCPGDATRVELPNGTVDYVVSSNVLMHVPPNVLPAIHAESFRILCPGGLAVHRINPGDQFARGDSSITTSNFLRYSEQEWHWFGGTGLGYHNRLRSIQHKEIFKAAGFAVLADKVRIDERSAAAIRDSTLPIHPDFARFTIEELATDYLWLVGQKPTALS